MVQVASFLSVKGDSGMTSALKPLRTLLAVGAIVVLWVSLIETAVSAEADTSPAYEEHLSHHPELQGEQTAQSPTAAGGTLTPGVMMDPRVMSKMMEEMRAPKPRDLYPSLMGINHLDAEAAQTAIAAAQKRMKDGVELLSESFSQLSAALDEQDYATMQSAVDEAARGLNRYRSGLATTRALSEGVPPQQIALDWFRTEMDLMPMADPREPVVLFGMSALHTGIMTLLIVAAAMFIWAYVMRMRRATALLGELTANPAERAAQIGVFVTPTETPEAQKPTAPLSVRQTWTGTLEVIAVFQETANVKTFRFALSDRQALPFAYEPGQFCTLNLDIEGAAVKRSYTIASSPTQRDYFELTIKREPEGQASRFIHDRVKAGDNLAAKVPLGRFYFNGTQADSIVLMAGGVGMTPMMSAIRFLTDRVWPGEIFLMYGCRSEADIIFREELERLEQRHRNLHVYISISRPGDASDWSGPTGRIDAEAIRQFVPDITSRRVHICGPVPMMDATKAHLESLGVAGENIKSEAFGAPVSEKASPPSPREPQADATDRKLAFARSESSTRVPEGQTVLEAAEAIGVDIDNSCRQGTCGLCIVKLLAGEVAMEVEDALEPEDKESGHILACQARLLTDCEVDA